MISISYVEWFMLKELIREKEREREKSYKSSAGLNFRKTPSVRILIFGMNLFRRRKKNSGSSRLSLFDMFHRKFLTQKKLKQEWSWQHFSETGVRAKCGGVGGGGCDPPLF